MAINSLFLHLMNITGVNVPVTFKANNNHSFNNRGELLNTLTLDLIKLEIHRRITLQMIPREINQTSRESYAKD